MLKDTALVSFLGVAADQAEVFRRASLVGKSDFKNLEALILAALIYWALDRHLHRTSRRAWRRRLSKGYVRTSHRLPPPWPRPPPAQGGWHALADPPPPVPTASGTPHEPGRRPTPPVVKVRVCASRSANSRFCSGVDLDVQRGEVIVIFGRSGSGKSTLLRCINFLEDPTEGTIEVAGWP